jgi:diguanylate cyclase (GGDEF)-like protein
MRSHLREVDIVARTGGDEFVLILPEIQPQAATAVLERVRTEVARVSDLVSATLGAVVLRAGQRTTLEQALAQADAALYEAKRAGKDRIVVIDESSRERASMESVTW